MKPTFESMAVQILKVLLQSGSAMGLWNGLGDLLKTLENLQVHLLKGSHAKSLCRSCLHGIKFLGILRNVFLSKWIKLRGKKGQNHKWPSKNLPLMEICSMRAHQDNEGIHQLEVPFVQS